MSLIRCVSETKETWNWIIIYNQTLQKPCRSAACRRLFLDCFRLMSVFPFAPAGSDPSPMKARRVTWSWRRVRRSPPTPSLTTTSSEQAATPPLLRLNHAGKECVSAGGRAAPKPSTGPNSKLRGKKSPSKIERTRSISAQLTPQPPPAPLLPPPPLLCRPPPFRPRPYQVLPLLMWKRSHPYPGSTSRKPWTTQEASGWRTPRTAWPPTSEKKSNSSGIRWRRCR